MKRMLITVFITGILGITVLCIPSFIVENLPKVNIINAKNIEYCDSVSATGEIQKGETNTVKSDMPLVVDNVLVQKGEYIDIGDTILTVNKQKSVAKMMEINNYASLSQLGAGSSITSYEDLIDIIPDKVISTVSGTIDTISTGNGGYIISGTPILSVVSCDSLTVSVNIPEGSIAAINVGQPVIITGSAFSDYEYHGVVEEISSVASKQFVGATQQTFVNIKVRFTDADNRIKVGYSANVKILTSKKRTISILPYETINQDDSGSQYVYVFNNGIAVRKDIETGVELGEGVEVVDGITVGDVVLSSTNKIENGEYVNLQD